MKSMSNVIPSRCKYFSWLLVITAITRALHDQDNVAWHIVFVPALFDRINRITKAYCPGAPGFCIGIRHQVTDKAPTFSL